MKLALTILVCLARVSMWCCGCVSEPDKGKGIETFYELRYASIVAQTEEYSCGAAALASLLNEYFGIQATQQEILGVVEHQMQARGEEPFLSAGLTAYDLKEASCRFGVELAGYEVTALQLADYFARGGLPLIAHVTRPGSHYVVVVGMRGEYVLLCDPGWGRTAVTVKALVEGRGMSGVILVALPNQEQATLARGEQTCSLTWMAFHLLQLLELRELVLP